MTTPNRWYQLSILQMLVTMAVVAVFVVKNTTIISTMPTKLASPYTFSIELGFSSLELGPLQAGWPIPYWHAFGTISTGQAMLAGFPKYRWWAFAANIAVCATAIAVTTMAITRLTHR